MTSEQVVNRFMAKLANGARWPLRTEEALLDRVTLYAALRETDREELLPRMPYWARDNPDHVTLDPLPEKIATAFADLLFGEDPVFTAANDGDQSRLEALLEGSSLIGEGEIPGELWEAERICVSEGEVWWRICSDYDVGHPIIEWHSRLDVLPIFQGKMLLGVAFVTELDPIEEKGEKEESERRWRHFELNTLGRVDNFLYRGNKGSVGDEVDLASHPETEALQEVWEHGLPAMLAGRIQNLKGRKGRGGRALVGRSQYHGAIDLIFDLSEAATIGKKNARLTLKSRAVVSQTALQQARGGEAYGSDVVRTNPAPPVFDASEELLIASGLDPSAENPFQILEYSFDADALVTWDTHLAKKILTRTDVAPQLVGYDDGGAPESGVALKRRFLNSVNAAEGKARPWDSGVPQILQVCAMLEGLPIEKGGFGTRWGDTTRPPSMERPDPLPESDAEASDRLSVGVGGKFVSRKTAVEELHPDWSEQQVADELESIRGDESSSLAMPVPFDPRSSSTDTPPEPGVDGPPGDGTDAGQTGKARGSDPEINPPD